jgi:hypothetical protein
METRGGASFIKLATRLNILILLQALGLNKRTSKKKCYLQDEPAKFVMSKYIQIQLETSFEVRYSAQMLSLYLSQL